MKILVLNGSPRPQGNTGKMVAGKACKTFCTFFDHKRWEVTTLMEKMEDGNKDKRTQTIRM